MQLERTIHLRVGMFLTAGCVLAMFAIFMIGSERAWFETRYRLYATFEDVSGIGTGAQVSLAGMQVGSVVGVQFPQDLGRRDVVVTFEINEDFQDRIRADSEASVVTQGLLGDKMISISVGSPDAAELQSGDQIKTTSVGDIYSLGKTVGDVVGDVRRILTKVDGLITDAKSGKGAVNALIYDAEGHDLVRNLNAGARDFRTFVHKAADEGDLSTVIANLNAASADIKQITGQVRRGEGTLGGVLTDDAIYNDLRALFGKASRNVLLRSVVRSMLRAHERSQGLSK